MDGNTTNFFFFFFFFFANVLLTLPSISIKSARYGQVDWQADVVTCAVVKLLYFTVWSAPQSRPPYFHRTFTILLPYFYRTFTVLSPYF